MAGVAVAVPENSGHAHCMHPLPVTMALTQPAPSIGLVAHDTDLHTAQPPPMLTCLHVTMQEKRVAQRVAMGTPPVAIVCYLVVWRVCDDAISYFPPLSRFIFFVR